MIRLFIFIWLLSICTKSYAQDTEPALIYPASIRMAEDAMADEDFTEALRLYNHLFQSAQHVMAKDAYNACQLAAIQGEPDFAAYYQECAKAGIPKAKLNKNILIWSKVASDTTTLNALYKEGYTVYLSRIDTTLRKEFIERYTLEQSSKGQSNYAMVCEDNFKRIFQLAKANRFPGENLIGPDDNLGNGYVMVTLLHYPYSFTPLKTYLLNAIDDGNLSPFQVCYVYGFNQTRTSVLYTREIPVDKANFIACYNMPFGRQSVDIAEVNTQRKLRYLPSMETERKLKEIALKYQIDFREGY